MRRGGGDKVGDEVNQGKGERKEVNLKNQAKKEVGERKNNKKI